MAGRGVGLDDFRSSIEIVSTFRNAPVSPGHEWRHPAVRKAAAR
jgi:UDP-N-acetyl-2-amino-2-deoxyglucuronate dehydrogenase